MEKKSFQFPSSFIHGDVQLLCQLQNSNLLKAIQTF